MSGSEVSVEESIRLFAGGDHRRRILPTLRIEDPPWRATRHDEGHAWVPHRQPSSSDTGKTRYAVDFDRRTRCVTRWIHKDRLQGT